MDGKQDQTMPESELAAAKIAALEAENEGLRKEVAKLRALLRSREQSAMSTRLKDALRE